MSKEHPILFKHEMVRAIIDGSKTQTRRLVKENLEAYGDDAETVGFMDVTAVCPLGFVGHTLWVRETFAKLTDGSFVYQANYPNYVLKWKPYKWKPAIHMPRAACRLTLKLTGIRIERLKEITASDAIAEGIELLENGCWKNYIGGDGFEQASTVSGFYGKNIPAEVFSYATLWDSINGLGSWNKNPYVWVYTFEVKGGQNDIQ